MRWYDSPIPHASYTVLFDLIIYFVFFSIWKIGLTVAMESVLASKKAAENSLLALETEYRLVTHNLDSTQSDFLSKLENSAKEIRSLGAINGELNEKIKSQQLFITGLEVRTLCFRSVAKHSKVKRKSALYFNGIAG
jgi:hypothetical protein